MGAARMAEMADPDDISNLVSDIKHTLQQCRGYGDEARLAKTFNLPINRAFN